MQDEEQDVVHSEHRAGSEGERPGDSVCSVSNNAAPERKRTVPSAPGREISDDLVDTFFQDGFADASSLSWASAKVPPPDRQPSDERGREIGVLGHSRPGQRR